MKRQTLHRQIWTSVIMAALAVGAGGTVRAQTVIDTLNNTSLSSYTLTPVLYSGSGVPATTTITFDDTSGALQATAANYNDIEQAVFLRNDYGLSVGQTLSVTLPSWTGTSQDFALCVASTATPPVASTNPLGNTRTSLSYAFIGIRGGANHLIASGFDGATSISTAQFQPGGTQVSTTLFITETAANTFTFGAFTSAASTTGGVTNLLNYTFVNNTGVGSAIGFYVDMRAANTIGSMSDLTIAPVPEPSTLALCGLGLAGLVAGKRRKQ
jgi:PEP-CTERM motif